MQRDDLKDSEWLAAFFKRKKVRQPKPGEWLNFDIFYVFARKIAKIEKELKLLKKKKV